MKISTEIGSLLSRPVKEALDIVKNAGFDCADYSFTVLPKTTLIELSDELETYRDIRRYADGIGLPFNQAHAPFASSTGDPDDDAVRFHRIANSITLAGILGVKHVIVHPKQHLPYRYNEAILKEMNYDFYRALIPYAEDAGVKIAIENMWKKNPAQTHIDHSVCSHIEEHIEYVDMLGSPVFEACLDVGHCALVGEDPAQSIRRLGHDRLHALHVHDLDFVSDMHTLPGCAKIDFKPIMRALRDIDYDGELTLEACYFLRGFEPDFHPEAVAFMAKRARFLADMKFED